jgi:F-type H+-transporting ATPase subunit a
LGTLVLASGDTYVPPSPDDLNFPEIFPGVTKPILQIAISVVVISVLMVIASGRLKLVPSKAQFLVEAMYDFVRNQIGRDMIGSKEVRPFIPLLLSLFTFILLNNLFGFIPFFQLPTMSHIAFPLGLAVMVWLLFIFLGIKRHGFLHYFGKTLFPPAVPKYVWPKYVWPLYAPVEAFSTFIMRPVTLTARLFATMFAGHIMLLVFVTGGEYFLIHGSIGLKLASPVAFALAIALSFIELLIQVLQAYVFTVLTANYIGGALSEEH